MLWEALHVGTLVDPQMFGKRSYCRFPVIAAVYVFFTVVCAKESEQKGLGNYKTIAMRTGTVVAKNTVLLSNCCSLKTLLCVNSYELVGEPLSPWSFEVIRWPRMGYWQHRTACL